MAEADCNEVLRLNPQRAKSLYRRDLARMNNENLFNLLEDFKNAYALDT